MRGAPLRTILRVPAENRGRRVPLVVALHFATGTGREMEQATRLTAEARRSGFDVAYPTATSDGFWQPSDLPKLQETIAAVERAACIDRSRVYVLGISNGGGMASLAACRMADTVAAVVLFAPAAHFAERCSPSRAVSVLEVHGTADPIVSYAEGRALVRAWARRDGCATPPARSRLRANAVRLRWRGCRDRAARRAPAPRRRRARGAAPPAARCPHQPRGDRVAVPLRPPPALTAGASDERTTARRRAGR